MPKEKREFYVYAYLREKASHYGDRLTPYYIGKGKGPRAFKNASRRCPKPKDNTYIVFIQEGLTEKEAFNLEKYCISLYGRIDIGTGILRNLTDGGDGSTGWKASQETKVKMSRAKIGKPLPLETKNKMSRALLGNQRWLGKQHTEETRVKMSKSSLKYRYEFISPNGEVYIVDNLKQFSKQNGLSDGHLNRVVNGKRKHHKGWTGKIIEKVR